MSIVYPVGFFNRAGRTSIRRRNRDPDETPTFSDQKRRSPARRKLAFTPDGRKSTKQYLNYMFNIDNYKKFWSLELAAVGAANAAKRAFLRFNATIGRRSKPCDPIKSNINEIPYRRNERIVIRAFGFLRSRSGRGNRREVRFDFRNHSV